MQKKISVIIPMYNAKKHLNRSFVTILNQTYENLEIICVNDGSCDGTKEAIEEFQKQDDRIILLNLEKSGVSHARNVGLKHASGDYIQFVDADDELELNYFELQLDLLLTTNSDCVICNNVHPFFYTYFTDRIYDMTNKKDFFEFYQHTFAPTLPWSKLYKREVLEGISFDENLSFAEDEAFFCKCMLKIKRIATTSKVLYHYYMATKENNGDQTSTLNQGINAAAFWDNNSSLFYRALECIPSRIKSFEKGLKEKLIPINSITDVIYQRVFDFTFVLLDAYVGFGLPEEGLGKELLHNMQNTYFQESCFVQEQYGIVYEPFSGNGFEERVAKLNHALYQINSLGQKRRDKNVINYFADLMAFAFYFVKECNDLDSYNFLNKAIKEYKENKTETAKLAHEVLDSLEK